MPYALCPIPNYLMHSYSLIAPAKINLYLEIIGDAGGGYHELAMVFQSIDLADRVDLRPSQQFGIRCSSPEVPQDKTNLAYRAAELMAREFPQAFARHGGAEITIDKRIPVAAGLAGGSTDAAAVLVGLDLMWQLGLTQPELQKLAFRLGADVPFCVTGGTALGTGRGEDLEPLPDLENVYAVLAKYRSLQVSTGWAYQTYRQQFGSTYISGAEGLGERRQRFHSGPIVGAIARRDSAEIGKLLHNDLEKVVLPAYPQVAQLRQALEEAGTLGAMMSGSGPTVFALVDNQERGTDAIERVKATLDSSDLDFYLAKFAPAGIRVAN